MTIREAVTLLELEFLVDESSKFVADTEGYILEITSFLKAKNSQMVIFVDAVKAYVGVDVVNGLYYMLAVLRNLGNSNPDVQAWLENALLSPDQGFCYTEGVSINPPFDFTKETRIMMLKSAIDLRDHLVALTSNMPYRTAVEFRVGASMAIEFLRRFEEKDPAKFPARLRQRVN
jgi:hypothetical protein